MEINRPKPADLLESIEINEKREKNGKLKIFFGYAAGVGKTYSMLKSARQVKESGVDVVCGYIEPHTRPDTMELVNGLECINKKIINYNGINLKEMDLDEVIKRNPELVLVDELAHTNAKGCRHEKRYQDIKELLNLGINVYTTVNVQHLESLCDIVAAITGVVVRERIPDSLFDEADEVQLVDVEPSELMERLKNGKIYKESQAIKALNNFFNEENLIALREIALRRSADRVNIIGERTKKLSGNTYYTEEKIAVGISSSPTNPKIIRAASRMAKAFGGVFIGIFVETPDFDDMSSEDKKRLKDNMHLAEQLGAQIETINANDIASSLAQYCKTCGISKIVVGRSTTKRSLIPKVSLIDKLTTLSPNLEIFIIPESSSQTSALRKKLGYVYETRDISKNIYTSILILTVCTLIGFLFYDLKFSEANIIIIYILGVLIAGVLTSSRVVSAVLSIISVLFFNFFFTYPRYTFLANNSGYPMTFLIMFFAALMSSSLSVKLKNQTKELAKSAYRTKVLLDISQLLQKERDLSGIYETTCNQLMKLLNKDVVFYGVKDEKLIDPIVYQCQNSIEDKEAYVSQSEKGVATWVYKNNKHAGATTSTLCSAACYYVGIRNLNEVYAVVGIRIKQGEVLAGFETSLVFAILAQAAEMIEKEILRKQREKAREQANNEKLRANLLRSISHDLRTPLTSISGNAGMLIENNFDDKARKAICEDIYDDSIWLINLVENLLSVTRIEDGTMEIKKQAELLEDIIAEALKHISKKSIQYKINVNMEDEMQLVKVDSKLIVQVIINIIDNAIKYTPKGSEINVNTMKYGKYVEVSICDNGYGISNENKKHIFDMFYTANCKVADSRRSLGLGLSLCKSIIMAHGGIIDVIDNKPRGCIFRFTLETDEVKIHE